MRLTKEKYEQLEDIAYQIRRLSIEMIVAGRWGHIGGSLSMAEIMACLYFNEMRIDPQNPDWEARDRLFLSKAHASPALYAALALREYFPVSELYTYCELGGLEGHTDMIRVNGIESSGGALGVGLSISVGAALGFRLAENPSARVYCVLGDGECNEGNVWEAAMSASHYHLDNLIAVVDYNKVMAKGFVWDEMSVEPFADKWRAFGWNVVEVDGHDIEALCEVFYKARWVMPSGKPIVIIAHTVKGKGLDLAEFNYKWHTHAPSAEIADEMLRQLSRRYEKKEEGYSLANSEYVKEAFYGGE